VSDFQYIGSELELFAAARNWKNYWSAQIRPLIRGDVVEVGAGIGTNTPFLDMVPRGRWICLEPDSQLAAQLKRSQPADRRYENIVGTLTSLPAGELFDTLIYIDVVEHIEDDRGELRAAASRLRAGGRVIVLSPAHQRLYTPFDKAIGHFRRYNLSMLRALGPPGLVAEKMTYLDSVGLLASTANLLFLKQSMPTAAQIGLWDRLMIPLSRVLDPLTGFTLGKTVVGVWRKPSDQDM
jgi:SAM-dependent methyltransferase